MSETATFHIAPHFTSHHNSHQIIPPHLSTPFHITPIPPRTTPCTSHSNMTHHAIPQHTSHTVFQLSFRITPCLIWRQTIPHHSVSVPQPYFTSCITAHHIPHAPHHDSTSHHISHLTLHDITASVTPYCTYSTSYLIPHQSQPHCKRCTSHQIPHHTIPVWWY